VKQGRRDLKITVTGVRRETWNVKDEGEYWEASRQGWRENWRLWKKDGEIVWKSVKGQELLRFYKFPEVLEGKWELNDGGSVVVKNNKARFEQSRRSYEMGDGGSVWQLFMNEEVFVIDKDEARKNSESAITWVSTFSNENVQWFRIPTDNKPVSDWGAFLKRKSASKRSASASDASMYYQGDEIYITDRNPAYKQWHFTKGVVIMRNEKKVVIQLSALGKVLEVVPRDISKVASGKVRSVKPKKESKKAYYLKHLRGKWYDSSGLEIEISNQYATFVRTKTRYRIIYEAQPPTMMIGRVRWELQPSKDNDRIFWTDFKNQMEWVRPGKAALSQPARVSPGFVPVKPNAPPKYEDMFQNNKKTPSAPPKYEKFGILPPSYAEASAI